jgi:hypothetical protein
MARRAVGTATLLATALALAFAAPARAEVEWLCKPGAAPNPCAGDLTTTIERPDGSDKVVHPQPPARRRIDCFYVYPTVSEDPGANSDKSRDPEMDAIARFQAQRFSQLCRVFAPIYRQRTLAAIAAGGNQDAALNLAYADVVEAWDRYLARHNRGRGVALIGHSQGSRMIRGLIRNHIDDRAAVRRRLVSAIIPGANVLVPVGRNRGGDFGHVPACTRPGQVGCVVAWSAYGETPPANSRFGRSSTTPDTSDLALPSGPGYEVVCTDPERLSGGTGRLTSLLPSEPFPGVIGLLILQTYGGSQPSGETPWLQPRDRYTGRCTSRAGADYLDVQPIRDARRLNPSPDDTWGLHIVDVNIAFGELLEILARQRASYLAARRG